MRDVPEMKATGLHIFARDVSVSHGFAYLEDFDRQLNVFEMDVYPGELVHADEHGAVVIPHAIAAEVAARGREIEKNERVILDLCRNGTFSIAKLDKLLSPAYECSAGRARDHLVPSAHYAGTSFASEIASQPMGGFSTPPTAFRTPSRRPPSARTAGLGSPPSLPTYGDYPKPLRDQPQRHVDACLQPAQPEHHRLLH